LDLRLISYPKQLSVLYLQNLIGRDLHIKQLIFLFVLFLPQINQAGLAYFQQSADDSYQ
jgi:hypothetical protein